MFSFVRCHGELGSAKNTGMPVWTLNYVDIGIWGYVASAVSDDTAVREIVYDPAAEGSESDNQTITR